jgi:hypothetical protein
MENPALDAGSRPHREGRLKKAAGIPGGFPFMALHCVFGCVLYTDFTFGIFPRPRQQWRGIFLDIERPKSDFDAPEILIVNRPEL